MTNQDTQSANYWGHILSYPRSFRLWLLQSSTEYWICLTTVRWSLVFIVAVMPLNCSFPYTYDGGLYYSCIENMAGVSTAQQPLACINVNATPANCDCPGSFVRHQLGFHNSWLLWFRVSHFEIFATIVCMKASVVAGRIRLFSRRRDYLYQGHVDAPVCVYVIKLFKAFEMNK